jgi:3-isopropylmalate/(R)-2-methylmalate dehydratase large subunit
MDTEKKAQTLFEKVWTQHQIIAREDGQVLLYVDRHLVQDVSAVAFEMLRSRGIKTRSPQKTFATPDHYVVSAGHGVAAIGDAEKRGMVETLARDSAAAGITHFGADDPRQGILHVVGPEQGLSWPGAVIVCGDSHTPTHGAFGALAFGVGATEVSQVLAAQSLWQRKPKTMRITIEGRLGADVSAKDLALAVIAKIGAAGAIGHVIEYAGSTITNLSMEGRMTVCNMSIEAGARAGMIAPDETTFAYLAGRPFAPSGIAWDRALARWRTLATDPGARFDCEVALDAEEIVPMVTWGTSPEDAVAITGKIPDPERVADADRRESFLRKLAYMGLKPGATIEGTAIDRVFIGSCTNGRIEDLRSAAAVARGRKVAAGVVAWVVPGSGLVKAQAEAEGLDRIFKAAGFDWRHPGCSMCLGTNGDVVAPGERCASTTNRNFVGRQGPGARTHLLSPAMAAAAAVTGHLTDVRALLAKAGQK